MKNRILVIALAVLLLPLTALAQKDVFEKYSDNTDVTYVNIKPKMFQGLHLIQKDKWTLNQEQDPAGHLQYSNLCKH